MSIDYSILSDGSAIADFSRYGDEGVLFTVPCSLWLMVHFKGMGIRPKIAEEANGPMIQVDVI